MRSLRFPNIINTLITYKLQKCLWMVFDYIPHSEDGIALLGYVEMADVQKIARDILNALRGLHSSNILHRDVKRNFSPNVLHF
jgi:serine/threonine protein kinase